jgi:hypothetical protein
MSDKGYTVTDRRGKGPRTEVCRVCGAPGKPEPHTRTYNSPTMSCIVFLREEIQRLAEKIKV